MSLCVLPPSPRQGGEFVRWFGETKSGLASTEPLSDASTHREAWAPPQPAAASMVADTHGKRSACCPLELALCTGPRRRQAMAQQNGHTTLLPLIRVHSIVIRWDGNQVVHMRAKEYIGLGFGGGLRTCGRRRNAGRLMPEWVMGLTCLCLCLCCRRSCSCDDKKEILQPRLRRALGDCRWVSCAIPWCAPPQPAFGAGKRRGSVRACCAASWAGISLQYGYTHLPSTYGPPIRTTAYP